MSRFENKVAVVTGASKGLGFAVAKAFAAEGAKVVMIARTVDQLEAAAAAVGENAYAFPMDVGYAENWEKLVAFIKEKFGEMDYLVNNAACLKQKDIKAISVEEFEETLRTNLEGPFLGTKYCYEVMKKGVYSAVVNVASVGARISGPKAANDPGYNSTKAGLIMLTKHTAYALGPDCIRANVVLPGGMNSAMRDAYLKQYPERAAASNANKPLPPHVAEPEEVAAAVLFCCDPACKSMSGAEIIVDNAMTTW